MSLLSVVQEVCEVVGVARPTSVFSGIASNRTMQEMAALANEMAQRIAIDARDWTMLRLVCSYAGNGAQKSFPLPANYQRMLTTGNVRSSSMPKQPLRFINDFDEWVARRLDTGIANTSPGEWTIAGGNMLIEPAPGVGVTITYPYLDKNAVNLASGGVGDVFVADTDSFRLPERLLRLGMIWQWKAQKGSPYLEDLSTYGDALTVAMGKDSPAPIIIDRQPLSHAINAQVAYPWPVPT